MRRQNPDHSVTRRATRRAVTLRRRLLGRFLAQMFRRVWRRLRALPEALRGAAELRALDERELRDLGLDAGGIPRAARHGRER